MTDRYTVDELRRAVVRFDRKRKRARARAEGAALLLQQIRYGSLPPPVLEYPFAKPRRWRFDFAWPEALVAAEYEGIHAEKSRHTTRAGFAGDCEKYNAAALAGWRVFRFVAEHVESGAAFRILEAALVVRVGKK